MDTAPRKKRPVPTIILLGLFWDFIVILPVAAGVESGAALKPGPLGT
jgi:hypothetical protein